MFFLFVFHRRRYTHKNSHTHTEVYANLLLNYHYIYTLSYNIIYLMLFDCCFKPGVLCCYWLRANHYRCRLKEFWAERNLDPERLSYVASAFQRQGRRSLIAHTKRKKNSRRITINKRTKRKRRRSFVTRWRCVRNITALVKLLLYNLKEEFKRSMWRKGYHEVT